MNVEDRSKAQITNEQQRHLFEELLLDTVVAINEIDLRVMSDGPNMPPPGWWEAMSRLRDECYRAKARL